MSKPFQVGEYVGAWGEGDSVYMITEINFGQAYLQAYSNTVVDGGWHSLDQLRKISRLTKTTVYKPTFRDSNG